MLRGTSFSKTNYDLLLNDWSALTLQNNVSFGVGTTKYCASTARASIISNFNWTISDGGADSNCPAVPEFSTYMFLLTLIAGFYFMNEVGTSMTKQGLA